MARRREPETIEIRGVSFEALAADTELAFEPPMIDLAQNPNGFVYYWKQIQRVFRLPDPNCFPPLGGAAFTSTDRALLGRYIETARDLASSSLISCSAKVQGGADSSGKHHITATDFPTREVTVGFSALFRQLYSPKESTHFSAIAGIIGRVNEQANDRATSIRRLQIKSWTQAQGKLQGYSLSALLGLQLEREGKWSSRMTPRLHDLNPQQLISLYLYGDLAHWDHEKRQKLALFKTENDIAPAREIDYFAALVVFSHIYIGFALLATAAMSGTVL